MTGLARALHYLNIALFLAIVGSGLVAYFGQRNPPAQLIALAVAIVGPLEDILKKKVRRGEPVPDKPAVEVVDKATSAAFLALLVWVVFIAR